MVATPHGICCRRQRMQDERERNCQQVARARVATWSARLAQQQAATAPAASHDELSRRAALGSAQRTQAAAAASHVASTGLRFKREGLMGEGRARYLRAADTAGTQFHPVIGTAQPPALHAYRPTSVLGCAWPQPWPGVHRRTLFRVMPVFAQQMLTLSVRPPAFQCRLHSLAQQQDTIMHHTHVLRNESPTR